MSAEPFNPTATLQQILRDGKKLEELVAAEKPIEPTIVDRLCKALRQLNEYIASGGDLPQQWDPCFDCGPEHMGPNRRCLRHGKIVPLRRPATIPFSGA